MNKKTKSTNGKKKTEFEFCKVCRLNHDQGNRHKYFPNHKNSLSTFLSKFQTKLADVRFFLKNPNYLRSEHASRNRIWCVFCDCDIDEIGSEFACSNAISHLASNDHLKNLKHFLRKHGGGVERVDAFQISEADLEKWEKKCKSLKNEAGLSVDGPHGLQIGPSNDIRSELKDENLTSFENRTIVSSSNFNDVLPLQYYTNEYQISQSGLSSVTNGVVHNGNPSLPAALVSDTSLWNSNAVIGNWNNQYPVSYNGIPWSGNTYNGGVYPDEGRVTGVASSQDLQITEISTTTHQEAGGNVHTGAPPPWFEASESNRENAELQSSKSEIALLSTKTTKSRKLNPNRVGAAWAERRKLELEMERRGEIVKTDFDADWLPNFGRVWQSGSRKESRNEFKEEKRKLQKDSSQSDTAPVTIQPYISKRMRTEANE